MEGPFKAYFMRRETEGLPRSANCIIIDYNSLAQCDESDSRFETEMNKGRIIVKFISGK
jgi:hypothetical protein